VAVLKGRSKFSDETFDTVSGCFHCRTDWITNRKQAALAINRGFAPKSGTSKPPNAGPTIPEMLNCKPLKVAAEGSSASDTTCGTIEVQVGALKANPTPRRKTPIRIRQGLRRCSQPRTANAAAVMANQRLIAHTSLFRFTQSARAPAGSVNRKKGSDATVEMSEIRSGEAASVFIT
jgi:hypothetical protein